VTEILIRYPDFVFQCQKDSSKTWYLVQPDSGVAKSWKVSSLLYDIRELKVARFIDGPYRSDAFYGFDYPEIELQLRQGNRTSVALLVGRQQANNVYLKNKITKKICQKKICQISKAKCDKFYIKTADFLED